MISSLSELNENDYVYCVSSPGAFYYQVDGVYRVGRVYAVLDSPNHKVGLWPMGEEIDLDYADALTISSYHLNEHIEITKTSKETNPEYWL